VKLVLVLVLVVVLILVLVLENLKLIFVLHYLETD